MVTKYLLLDDCKFNFNSEWQFKLCVKIFVSCMSLLLCLLTVLRKSSLRGIFFNFKGGKQVYGVAVTVAYRRLPPRSVASVLPSLPLPFLPLAGILENSIIWRWSFVRLTSLVGLQILMKLKLHFVNYPLYRSGVTN